MPEVTVFIPDKLLISGFELMIILTKIRASQLAEKNDTPGTLVFKDQSK